MKIKFEEKDKILKSIEDIKMGEVFKYRRDAYMKLGEYTCLFGEYNVIRLSDGSFRKLSNNEEVEIVDCELVIKS